MKKQMNFGLFLVFLLIVWLFYNSYCRYVKYNHRYAFHSGLAGARMVILDKVTGETWRYFANMEGGEIAEEGWCRLGKKE